MKEHYSPAEAIDYLNKKFHIDPPLNLARLARLRREKRVSGERVGTSKTSVYTKKTLDAVSLEDIRDQRKKPLDKSRQREL